MPATATRFPILTDTLTNNKLRTSPTMLAILGCICGVIVTDPAIEELGITSDGYVLARHDSDCGLNDMLGSAADLDRNLRGVCDVLEIEGAERVAILTAVKRW